MMSATMLLGLCILSLICAPLKAAPLKFQPLIIEAHMTLSRTGEYEVVHGPVSVPATIASFSYHMATNTTGWNYAYGWTNGSYSDEEQAYTIGYLEGRSDPLIHLHYRNTMGGQCTKPATTFCKKLLQYLTTNLEFMKNQIIAKRAVDPYWHQVELLLWQIQGMDDAFKNKPSRSFADLLPSKLDLDPFGMFLWHVSGGDMEELSQALKPKSERTADIEMVKGYGHCSALIKKTPGPFSQIFVAQETWNGFESMLRHMKLYEFNYRQTSNPNSAYVAGVSQSFSSYPGSIVSGDDFYVLGSQMVSQETTTGFYNASLYDIVRDSAGSVVFEFLRSQVANRLARNVGEWQKYFSHLNSGTYNNQWMVVDYKNVEMGKPLPSTGVLGISEQLPGLLVSKDMTKHLQETTYWPSYNSPSFPEIFDRAGMPAMVKKFGDWFSYENTPRAKIFRRDHHKIVDLQSMIRMMRYNNFKHDPLSRCACTPPYSAENAIAARSDLNLVNGKYPFGALGHRNHGATDMKLTTQFLLNDMGFIGISSPTYDYLPPFRWSTSGFNISHFGQPDLWQFQSIITPWRRINGRDPSQKSFVLTPDHVVIIPH